MSGFIDPAALGFEGYMTKKKAWAKWPTRTTGGSPRLVAALQKPLTFEEYTAMCDGDGEPPPSREQYDAAIQTPAIGEIGSWRGVRFVADG